MDPRPEDRKDAEIADGAGELGFFPPYSWWPLWCGVGPRRLVFGIALGAWWLFIIGVVLGALALCGLDLRVLPRRARALTPRRVRSAHVGRRRARAGFGFWTSTRTSVTGESSSA